MKFLYKRERIRRSKFSKIEIKYIALRSIIHNQRIPLPIRWEASLLLSKLVKLNKPATFTKRCFLTGRARGFFNFFKLSRIQALDLARNGELPGIYKATW